MELDTNLSAKADRIDLFELYPNSRRLLLKRSWRWLSIFLALLFLVITRARWRETSIEYGGVVGGIIDGLSFYLLFGSLALVSLKLIYEEFFFATFRYEIDSGNVVVLSGVFTKIRSSFPLSRVTDVYLERDIIDFLLQIFTVNIVTANSSSEEHGAVLGLPRNSAVALQDYITSLLTSVHTDDSAAVSNTDKPVADESTDVAAE